MTTTWNPSDKAAGITLTSTNHVATSSGGNNSVRGTTSHNTSKWYIEFNTISFVGSALVGLADSSQSLSTNTMSNAGGCNDGNNFNDGWVGAQVGMGGTVAGHIVSVAVDLDANKMWCRLDAGNWVGDGSGTGDPVAGTHGADIHLRSGALFPFFFGQNGGAVTINAGDSAFSESVPSGYTPWDNPVSLFKRRCLVIF